MRGKRPIIVLATVLLATLVAVGVAVASHTAGVTAHATQHPANQSGAQGSIDFAAASLQAPPLVTGTATGLEGPSVGRYVSLVYDLGSVPGGPVNCEPTVELPGMFVGIWAVDAAGNGTLIQLNPAVDPLAVIDTISIRDETINGGFGPEAVVACGQIAVHDGRK
jgi:hypothetical protein